MRFHVYRWYVFSESEEQHYKDLKKVVSILEKSNFQISVDKCYFYKYTINFLGHNVRTGGLKPMAQKVKDTKFFLEPKDAKSQRRLLGMAYFCRKLIPRAADMLLPLAEAIKHNPAAKVRELSLAEKQAFVT